MKNNRGFTSGAGFTLLELLVVLALAGTLLGFIIINLSSSQQNISLTSTSQVLISDLRQNQIKAMVGDTEGRSTSDSYGVHFDSDKYVFFHGTTYSSSDPSNFTVIIPSNMQFESPGFDIIFSKITGEIASITNFQLTDVTTGRGRKIYLNKLGVVDKLEIL